MPRKTHVSSQRKEATSKEIMLHRSALVLTVATMAITLLACEARAAGLPKATYSMMVDGAQWELKFAEVGKFTYSINQQILVEGTYRVTKDEIQFSEENGPIACRGDVETGRYQWKLEGKTLTFTEIQDECVGRESIALYEWAMQQ